jgi:hypothetical protein
MNQNVFPLNDHGCRRIEYDGSEDSEWTMYGPGFQAETMSGVATMDPNLQATQLERYVIPISNRDRRLLYDLPVVRGTLWAAFRAASRTLSRQRTFSSTRQWNI